MTTLSKVWTKNKTKNARSMKGWETEGQMTEF